MTAAMTAPIAEGWRARASYLQLCIGLGMMLGWLPLFFHGPAREKFDVLYIQGGVAVWGWYVARMSIGFWIGVSTWPRPWWLRGPLCGLVALLPLTLVSLAMPGCGWP
jgi:hypothetical protein